MTGALCAHPAFAGVSVSGVKPTVIASDRGFASVIARLQLSCDGRAQPRIPKTVIAKFPMASPTEPSSYQKRTGEQREVRIKAFERGTREMEFLRCMEPMRWAWTPQLFYGGSDPSANRIVLLLEDVDHDAEGDDVSGCAAEEAEAVLDSIGALHVRYLGRRPRFDWLPSLSLPAPHQARRLTERIRLSMSRHGDRLDPDARDLLARISNCFGGLVAAAMDAPHTVVHGDLHLDNVLFTHRADGTLAHILDWQCVLWAPVAYDLVLTLSSVTVDANPATMRRLLAGHRDRLVPAASNYTAERLHDDWVVAMMIYAGSFFAGLADLDLHSLKERERQTVDVQLVEQRLLRTLLENGAERVMATL